MYYIYVVNPPENHEITDIWRQNIKIYVDLHYKELINKKESTIFVNKTLIEFTFNIGEYIGRPEYNKNNYEIILASEEDLYNIDKDNTDKYELIITKQSKIYKYANCIITSIIICNTLFLVGVFGLVKLST